jgi:4'-phosphopantetheinyl transferase
MLGCDLELVEPRSDAFLADYYTDKEQDILRAASGAERDRIANLLWSAKESALKALREGLRLNPLSLSVHLPDRPLGEIAHENIGAQFAAGTDQTGDWQPLQVTWAGGRIFPGWWCQTGAMLRTLVAFPAPEQPKPFSRSTGCNASGLPAERLYHATS